VLDVVYNHLGPEGNYLPDFAPYFTDIHRTPWGDALNFDAEYSDDVRRFFLENALYWFRQFHVDALRLDAVHAIRDYSAIPFLQELARATDEESRRSGRSLFLMAESDLNNPRLIHPQSLGGYGLLAQWSDDFHHCLHVLLTGERMGYYQDFGSVIQLAKIFREGFAHTGDYSPFRKRAHGAPTPFVQPKQLVVYAQNHDQIGNRAFGERLSRLVSFEGLKLAAGTVVLSPFLPLLFMGEEQGERTPFLYMTSHGDPALVEAVRKGRRGEFSSFGWKNEVPDPQLQSTLERSVLHQRPLKRDTPGGVLFAFYQELIRIRKSELWFVKSDKHRIHALALEEQNVLVVRYEEARATLLLLLNFSKEPQVAGLDPEDPALGVEVWTKLIESSDAHWNGPGGSVPALLRSTETAQVKLAPESLCLLSSLRG
jgi:maltooligosyltrehalose trehalohydrolase